MCASLPNLEHIVIIEQGEVARTIFVGSCEILPITNQVIPCPFTQRALPLESHAPCKPYPLHAMPLKVVPLACHTLKRKDLVRLQQPSDHYTVAFVECTHHHELFDSAINSSAPTCQLQAV